MRWSYGVTTVPSRRQDLLPRTLESLKAAGFDSPRLFVDGQKDPVSYVDEFKLEVTSRWPVVKAYGNWILALAELYVREPAAERYAIFQDDFVTCLNLRTYLDRCKYPEKGYLNLYTFPSNQRDTLGWYPAAMLNSGPAGWQTGRGAVGLVFDLKAVQTLLIHQHMVERPADPGRHSWKKIDGAVVTAMNKAGYKEHVHNPSLIQHVGKLSTLGNQPHKQATSFRGEQFDANTLP